MTAPTRDGRHAIAERNTEAIIQAALRVLKRNASAGLGDIAAEAGVGRATVYRHFPNRAALLEALQERGSARLAQIVRAASREQDVRQALIVLVSGFFELWELYGATIPEDYASRERRAQWAYAPLVEMVRKAQAEGQIKPVDPEWFVTALRGLQIAAVLGPTRYQAPIEELPELIVDTLLDGLAAS